MLELWGMFWGGAMFGYVFAATVYRVSWHLRMKGNRKTAASNTMTTTMIWNGEEGADPFHG